MNHSIDSSFDAAAKDYDANFTFSEIGKLQRARVYHWLNSVRFFNSPKKVFEINCGTAYDAEEFFKKGHQVVATDASAAMIEYAEMNRSEAIEFYRLDMKNIKEVQHFQESEVLFSNFGGLNCLNSAELNDFVRDISEAQQSGNQFVGVFMAKGCWMEDLYHFLKFQWSKIGRRASPDALEVQVNGVGVKTYYHSPTEVTKALAKKYKIVLKRPVAFFLPPSYLEPFFKKRKWLLRILNNLEQLFGRLGALSSWSDHYIIIAEKR